MNNSSCVDGAFQGSSTTVSFGERYQSSQQFDHIFKVGMALVERTAAYLDGQGRKESKGLPPSVNVLYATESMRLTTRLLEVASWLLIRRGVKEGELTQAEAEARRAKTQEANHQASAARAVRDGATRPCAQAEWQAHRHDAEARA